jgi:hypothetical protein
MEKGQTEIITWDTLYAIPQSHSIVGVIFKGDKNDVKEALSLLSEGTLSFPYANVITLIAFDL